MSARDKGLAEANRTRACRMFLARGTLAIARYFLREGTSSKSCG